MFTGIIEELGEVVRLERGSASARVTVRGPVVTSDATHGASIAVNGICLTVVEHDGDTFSADVMLETLQRTSLATLQAGTAVNLERPVPPAGRLGGHMVQGHVDGVGMVADRQPGENWEVVLVDVPADLARYVVAKGSIAIDGVSLTIASLHDLPDGAARVGVSLIPETLARTTLGRRAVGELVNLEVDVLAKYIERLVSRAAVPGTVPATTAAGVLS